MNRDEIENPAHTLLVMASRAMRQKAREYEARGRRDAAAGLLRGYVELRREYERLKFEMDE